MELRPRAYLINEKEFYEPEGDGEKELSEFFAVLEGYKLKGKRFIMDYGSGVMDTEGREIFTGDILEVFVRSNKKEDKHIREVGFVVFEDGTFLIRNDSGFEYELGLCVTSPDDMHVRIMGNKYGVV